MNEEGLHPTCKKTIRRRSRSKESCNIYNTSFNISAHPNAGLPNAFGQYDETPKEMQSQIREYLDENLINIIGGCCGTNPDHIKLIAEVAKDYKPRKVVG